MYCTSLQGENGSEVLGPLSWSKGQQVGGKGGGPNRREGRISGRRAPVGRGYQWEKDRTGVSAGVGELGCGGWRGCDTLRVLEKPFFFFF